MLTPLAPLTLLALGAASVQPAQVPAAGRQEAVVTLDRAQMVRLSADSAVRTACELVDHQRGPFERSGTPGKEGCRLELLLDAGAYKLRLDSPARGKGKVTLKAEPFAEVNQPLVRLEPHRRVEQTVHPGQQASYWLRVEQRQQVTLQVWGRTAGQVEVWRNGEWREDVGLQHETVSLRTGQNLHHWSAQPTLEAGNYLLTVYGARPVAFSEGKDLDLVAVAWGYDPAPAERMASITLGALGRAGFELPAGRQVVVAERLSEAGDRPVQLRLVAVDEKGQSQLTATEGGCTVDPKALVPQCVAQAYQKAARHLLEVSGPPGTRLELSWGPLADGLAHDGEFVPPGQVVTFEAPASGPFLVATRDLAADRDAAPLACELEHVPDNSPARPIADDFLTVSESQPFAREFNYDGASETVWFNVAATAVYRVATTGDRKSGCELFRFDGPDRHRVATPSIGQHGCELRELLSAGRYELRLYGGNPGIERLSIAKGTAPKPESGTKSGCRFARVELTAGETYRIALSRTGRVGARGLVLRPLPLSLVEPLHLRLERGETVEAPLAPGRAATVRAPLGGGLTCSLGEAPGCALPETAEPRALVLRNTGKEGVDVTAWRPVPQPPPPPLPAFSPQLEPVPELAVGQVRNLDFERSESHSLVFTVKQAGLYDVTTEGLLATSCTMRTAITADLASDQGSGRGRNCLVATYLREGRYLLTVATVGQSRGRAGVLLSRRPVRDAAPLAADAQAFFRVGPGELLREKLTVRKAGEFTLSTSTLAGQLQCRLEDKDGWPVIPAPTACASVQALRAGSYAWLQLPLTVASMRHSVLERVRVERPLAGAKQHELQLNRWYTARLSKKGQDDLRFTVEADLDVHVALTDGMQGRLYAVAADGTRKPVEFIPPQQVRAPAPAYPTEEVPPEGDGEGEAPPPRRYEEGDEGEGQPPPEEAEPQLPATPVAPPPVRPQAPVGQVVHLAAGSYQLVTQHSRGDVGITYRVQLGVQELAPGVALTVNAPARLALRVPRDGTLRLRTQGETDVRCRLFDARGRLAHESSENGDDWNCALAEPLRAGNYELVIESETQVPGVTTVSVEMPRADDAGELKDGAELKVGANVATATLPAAEGISELTLRSKDRFACALERADGTLLHRETRVTTCAVLARTGKEPLRVRVWTLDRPASVKASLSVKPLDEGGSTIAAGRAVRAKIARPGRYETSQGIYCLPEGETGALLPCGPEVSLEPGPVVFAALGAKEAKLPLDEQTLEAGAAKEEPLSLSRRRYIQAVSASKGVQLVRVLGTPGDRVGPSCQFEGGTRVLAEGACYAASPVGERSVLRAWAPSEDAIEARIERVAVPWPSKTTPLAPGRAELAVAGGAVRLAAPATPWRSELTLPPLAWAVRLDGAGAPADLCPPQDALSACTFEGKGGEVLVYSPGEPRLEAATLLVESEPRAEQLTSLLERRADAPGTLRLRVAPAASEREVEVEGAERCAVKLEDGTRLYACRAVVPAGQSAFVAAEHGGGALRATLHAPGAGDAARFGAPPATSATPLAQATQAPLVGAAVERTLTVERDAVLHVQSSAGVCGLLGPEGLLGQGGLGAGCDLYRLVRPGSYRLLVRRFADVPLAGAVSWTAEPVEDLGDGVGPERWLAPGQARFFRFQTASEGQVGLGLQAGADTLECAVYDARQQKLGEGCQQFLTLPAGSYVLAVRAPPRSPAARVRPVVLGLAGARMDVPEEYLRDFFSRIRAER